MVNQKFSRQMVAKLSKQDFLAIVMANWNVGRNVPVLRLQCNSSTVVTFQGPPSMVMAIPRRPSLASDDSAKVHR